MAERKAVNRFIRAARRPVETAEDTVRLYLLVLEFERTSRASVVAGVGHPAPPELRRVGKGDTRESGRPARGEPGAGG